MTSDSWFRFYNTAIDHPKVTMLSAANFRAWVTLLSLASKLDGVIPNNGELLSRTLRMPLQKANDVVQVLLSAKLLDRNEDNFIPHNWAMKQFKSDVSTERVKRFRERERNVSETDHRQRTETETKKKKVTASATRFDEFWSSCPKKTGRGLAEKAYLKALTLADEDTLIGAMARYADTQIGKDKSYVKTPGPWLNEKRWLDEGIAPAAADITPEQIAANIARRDALFGPKTYRGDA